MKRKEKINQIKNQTIYKNIIQLYLFHFVKCFNICSSVDTSHISFIIHKPEREKTLDTILFFCFSTT